MVTHSALFFAWQRKSFVESPFRLASELSNAPPAEMAVLSKPQAALALTGCHSDSDGHNLEVDRVDFQGPGRKPTNGRRPRTLLSLCKSPAQPERAHGERSIYNSTSTLVSTGSQSPHY
jgi:hypothetical protein